ncbi:MAG: hypothetical protein ACI9EQ_001511, partial [Bacteroidia bacterium]
RPSVFLRSSKWLLLIKLVQKTNELVTRLRRTA